MNFLKTLDVFLDKHWRITHSIIIDIFNIKIEDDIDWLNMHNDMVQDKNKNE